MVVRVADDHVTAECDADAVGLSHLAGPGSGAPERAHERARRSELVDPVDVALEAFDDEHVARGVDRHPARTVQLAGTAAADACLAARRADLKRGSSVAHAPAERPDEGPGLGELADAMVAVLGDDDIAGSVNGHASPQHLELSGPGAQGPEGPDERARRGIDVDAV